MSIETIGTLFSAVTGQNVLVQRAPFGGAINGNNTMLAAQTGKIIVVVSMLLVAGAAGNIYFTDGAGGAVIFGDATNKIALTTNSGFTLPRNVDGWMATSAGNALILNASSTGPFSGGFTYYLL